MEYWWFLAWFPQFGTLSSFCWDNVHEQDHETRAIIPSSCMNDFRGVKRGISQILIMMILGGRQTSLRTTCWDLRIHYCIHCIDNKSVDKRIPDVFPNYCRFPKMLANTRVHSLLPSINIRLKSTTLFFSIKILIKRGPVTPVQLLKASCTG